MIKNDFRYIIKRIIIGIGICLGLSFLSGCTPVFAYEMNDDDLIVSGSYNSSQCRIYYSIDENKIFYYARPRSSASWSQLISLDYNSNYTYSFIGMTNTSLSPQRTCTFYYFTSDIYLDNYVSSNITRNSVYSNYSGSYYLFATYDGTSLSSSSNKPNNYTPGLVISNGGTTIFNITDNNVTNFINKSIYDNRIKDFTLQDKVLPVFSQPTTSTIEDLGIQRNFDDNNILASVTFSPTFDNFDTTNFTYQYKICNNNWLTITSNDVTFNVNQNTSVYFRILKNSDNSVVDSRIYTITQIGVYEENSNDYKVVYTSDNKSVDSSSSSPNRTIDRVTINFEYFPKISNLKYQYQFVEADSSLSDWIDMPSNDFERGYTTLVNGTLYNRILDSDDNVLYTSTFNVNSIGKLMLDDNVSWYSSLFKKIDYGSGIGSIFFLPVRLIESIQSNFGQSCTSYNLGSLLGTDLIIPCIDIKSHIGSSLYNTIDIIFMGFIILSLIKFIKSVYNRIISLNFNGNDDGEGVLFL